MVVGEEEPANFISLVLARLTRLSKHAYNNIVIKQTIFNGFSHGLELCRIRPGISSYVTAFRDNTQKKK